MPVRVGILSVAHMHVWSYLGCLKNHPDAELVGIWDDDVSRLDNFGASTGTQTFASLDELLGKVDAVVICSENVRHGELGLLAAKAGKHILCEKPLEVTLASGEALVKAARDAGVVLMTAFPCRFSPAYASLREQVKSGTIGPLRALCTTNRGTCPFDWFVEKEKSGGGAMIDHTVHVADLLKDLLGEEPIRVQAQIGNNMYGETWEDTAMVTLEYPSGIFATLDSSWSRPKSFRTWGDVTIIAVGEKGVIEMDMFGQDVQVYKNSTMRHSTAAFGSNADGAMVDAFIESVLAGRDAPVTGEDGLAAAKVALAAYRSVEMGQPVSV